MPDTANRPFDGFKSDVYQEDAFWACLPGMQNNQCAGDLTATVWAPDGSTDVVVEPAEEKQPAFDCFYVYPTVNLVDLPLPGPEDKEYSDPRLIGDPLLSQVASFRSMCRVFAPRYRAAAITDLFGVLALTELLAGEVNFDLEALAEHPLFKQAYADVLDAFKHYMGQWNDGRPFVLIGHSQGSILLTTLLQREFEQDPVLLDQLISAVLIGGFIEVPAGQTVGGTFETIPVCTQAKQSGCIIAYNSHEADDPGTFGAQTTQGFESVCTNPAELLGGGQRTRFSGTLLPTDFAQPLFGVMLNSSAIPTSVETPFVIIGDYFVGECQEHPTRPGFNYLGISAEPRAGDVRNNPVSWNGLLFELTLGTIGFGLHVLDYQWPFAELIELVATQAEYHRH